MAQSNVNMSKLKRPFQMLAAKNRCAPFADTVNF